MFKIGHGGSQRPLDDPSYPSSVTKSDSTEAQVKVSGSRASRGVTLTQHSGLGMNKSSDQHKNLFAPGVDIFYHGQQNGSSTKSTGRMVFAATTEVFFDKDSNMDATKMEHQLRNHMNTSFGYNLLGASAPFFGAGYRTDGFEDSCFKFCQSQSMSGSDEFLCNLDDWKPNEMLCAYHERVNMRAQSLVKERWSKFATSFSDAFSDEGKYGGMTKVLSGFRDLRPVNEKSATHENENENKKPSSEVTLTLTVVQDDKVLVNTGKGYWIKGSYVKEDEEGHHVKEDIDDEVGDEKTSGVIVGTEIIQFKKGEIGIKARVVALFPSEKCNCYYEATVFRRMGDNIILSFDDDEGQRRTVLASNVFAMPASK